MCLRASAAKAASSYAFLFYILLSVHLWRRTEPLCACTIYILYSFVLSARLVKTCQWTFKGSIVIYKITTEGGNKCCLRYWIVGTEPVMQLLFGYIFRWLIRSSTNPCFESRGVWSLNLLNTRKEIIFKNTIILRNPPFGSVSNVMQACTNDKSGKMSKHCNPISYFTM